MASELWQPSASVTLIKQRALLYGLIRQFFADRSVLEVEVPLLSRHGTTDPHIESVTAELTNQLAYLQTSPEFFMKRLLCAGSGDIYSLGKAFRNGEQGSRHNPEFTLLEWYRVGFDEQRLMDEVAELIQRCLPIQTIEKISYRELFLRHLGFDPHLASLQTLTDTVQQFVEVQWQDEDRDVWLDLLMTHAIEPDMGSGLLFVYDYPASQAALARIQPDATGRMVAKRFEAYLGGMELANGYWELCDAKEQQSRLMADNARRQVMGLKPVNADKYLVDALGVGMPECAGVALGVDRLLMLQTESRDIASVLAFAADRI